MILRVFDTPAMGKTLRDEAIREQEARLVMRRGKQDFYKIPVNQKEFERGCVSYFSPDDSKILYGVYYGDTNELMLTDSNGSDSRNLGFAS